MRRRLLKELERRNVLKVAVGYLVAAWLIAQVADLLLGSFTAPDWTMRALLIALAIGFPVALFISWTFEVTSEGVIPESEIDRTVRFSDQGGRRTDLILLLIIAVVIVFMGLERFVFSRHDGPGAGRTIRPEPTASAPEQGRANSSPPGRVNDAAASLPGGLDRSARSVAVLPFAVLSSGPDDDYFAAGLTEQIINGLSLSPDLLVTARTSAFGFRNRSLPIGEIARRLGVAHIVEGSVLRAGEQLRVTAQLVRADTGLPLWSDSFDHRTTDLLVVQQDIVEQVATALGAPMDETLRERMRRVGTPDAEAFISYQKGVEYHERAHTDPNPVSLLRRANAHFEQAFGRAPELSDAYEYHADLFSRMLISQAAGTLDGEITAEDTSRAPERLRWDYEQASRYARTAQQRNNAEFGRALALGPWHGLDIRALKAATESRCEAAPWLHLVVPLVDDPGPILGAFRRMAACDPLRYRPHVHTVGSWLWHGAADRALATANDNIMRIEHPLLARHLALSLAFLGEAEAAQRAALRRIRSEDELLVTQSMLAAIRGEAEAAREYEDRFLGGYGPNDRESLVLAAARGDRFEANRLAAAIDARSFGHLVLLQAVYACLCGAPFDRDATPRFAALLADSGLNWPPPQPFTMPLKTW